MVNRRKMSCMDMNKSSIRMYVCILDEVCTHRHPHCETITKSNLLCYCNNVCGDRAISKANNLLFLFSLPDGSLTDLMQFFHTNVRFVQATTDHEEKCNYRACLQLFLRDPQPLSGRLKDGDSEEGDVWWNLKAVLIYLNCVCSVCHY